MSSLSPKSDQGMIAWFYPLFSLVLLRSEAIHGQPRYSFRRRPPARNLSAAIPVTMDDRTADALIRSHSFVFVGGVPQSGTSLLRTLIASSELISGQDSCLATTRCFETNVEGQWLLDRKRDDMRDLLQTYYSVEVLRKLSGPQLLDDRNASSMAGSRLFANWARYWDLSKPVLLEKSPPNLLKMGYLTAAFSHARAVKFLVILKDPITNNLFYRPRQLKETLLRRAATRLHFRRNIDGFSPAQGGFPDSIVTQFDFLDDWLTSHERVLNGLAYWSMGGYSGKISGEAKQFVKFLRYESLGGGVPCELCRKLFRFLLGDDLLDHYRISASPEPSPCVEISPKCGGSSTERQGGFPSRLRIHGRRELLAMIDERQARERGRSNEKNIKVYTYYATRKRRRDRWKQEFALLSATQRKCIVPFSPRLSAFGYSLFDDKTRDEKTAISDYLIN